MGSRDDGHHRSHAPGIVRLSRSFRFFACCRSGSSSSVCAVQPKEVYVDDESKLTLHGLVQHFIMLTEPEKNRKLCDVLDALDFNQVEARLLQTLCVGT